MSCARSRSPSKTRKHSAVCSIAPVSFRGRQAVRISNDIISLTIYCGGGHLALLQFVGEAAGADDDFGSPLWIPPWSTVDPAVVAAVPSSEFGESPEGTRLLPHIAGHNLCLDVFGSHSQGEEKYACLGLHGEAGQVTWVITSSKVCSGGMKAELTMTAHLRHTALEVSRIFTVAHGDSTIAVIERVKNLVGFERVFGRANHVTLGSAFLRHGETTVTANVTRGKTFPEQLSAKSSLAADTEFDYPHLPSRNGATLDWRYYPRTKANLDLCSCIVDTASDYGWMCAHNRQKCVALCYVWERKAFPWLTNWEENFATDDLPWSGRTLTRGLEFSSYAFPTSRQKNVQSTEIFGVPCFEWLDAYAERSDRFWLSLHRADRCEEPLKLRQRVCGSSGAVVIESDAGFKLLP